MALPDAKIFLAAMLALSACTDPQFLVADSESPRSARESEAGAETYVESQTDAAHDKLDVARGDAKGTPDPIGSPDRDASTDSDLAESPEAGAPACSLTGTFSVRSDMLVSWVGKTYAGFQLVRPGTGKAQVFARVVISFGNDRKLKSEATLCGARLPEFNAGDGTFFRETYGFYLQDDIWDRPTMPRWPLAWAATCAEPGCTLISDVLEAPVGANGYVDAPAPIETKDHDGDGFAGVTVAARGPTELSSANQPYTLIPLSGLGEARSEHVFAVVLFKAQYNTTFRDCDYLDGNSNQTRITLRTAGCLAINTRNAPETPCTAEQTMFVAENIPDVSVSPGATLEMRRVADGADCAAVRRAWP
jgi:hypothetical protein